VSSIQPRSLGSGNKKLRSISIFSYKNSTKK
jgi:hypothetical protein